MPSRFIYPSFVVELLSELPALPAGYPGTRNQGRAKTAAISANKRRVVNLFSRQTLRLGRGIQISARGVARQCSTNLNTKFPKEAFQLYSSPNSLTISSTTGKYESPADNKCVVIEVFGLSNLGGAKFNVKRLSVLKVLDLHGVNDRPKKPLRAPFC
jgi:hypothetical protein